MHLRYLNLDENGRETYGALVLWCFDEERISTLMDTST